MIMITNAAMVHALARSSIISTSFRNGAPFFPDAMLGRIRGCSARFFFGSIDGKFGDAYWLRLANSMPESRSKINHATIATVRFSTCRDIRFLEI